MKILPKFLDPTDVTTLVNRGTGKHVIADGLSVIPVYKGKQYSIKDVVNKDGTVNVKKAKKIMEEVAEYFGGKKMQNRSENPIWHKDDPNTWLHTKKVAQNAWVIPVPEGYTKQDQMIAALGHDFGKILSGDGHAEVSYNLIKQIFPDATPKQLEAVRKHMDDLGTHTDILEQATKFADIGVIPGTDLTQIGLTPEELEIVKQIKWFKEGGNVQYFDKGGAVVEALTHAKDVIKRAPSVLRNKISKVVVANNNGTIFQVFEQLPNGTRRLAGQLELNIGEDFVWPKYVKKLDQDAKHVSQELYDAAIAYHNKPLVSGWELLAPEATQATWAKYFNKTELSGEVGKHRGEAGIIMSLNQPSQKVVLMKPWQDGTVIKLEEYAKGEIPKKLPEPEFIKRKKKELEERQNDLNIHPHDWDIPESKELDDEDEFFAKILAGKSLYRNGGTLETSTKLNKFQEGGVLEEPIEIPMFRHLPNEYIAQDFDNDLTELFYSRQIKYGQLSEKAERKLQKKYNLDYIQLKETLDDLFNAGLGEALIADLIKANTNLKTFKQGGTIQKCSIGSAIRKFAGEGLSRIEKKYIKGAEEDLVLQATGTTKVIGKATTEHLKKVAKATNDQRIRVLADFAKQCRDKGIKLPEEFNQFVDAIFKVPVAVKTDKKIVRVGKEVTADPEIITYRGISVERPTFDKIKYKTKTEHTGEFKDKLEFKRTVPKTQKELQELSPKIDEAISSLRSMMEGDSFKLTPTMMDEIYAKSKGRVQNFKDNKEQTGALRKLFGEIEYPTLVKRQLDKSYVYPQAPSQELTRFYNANAENIEWFKRVRDLTQQYMNSSDYYGPVGKIQVTPLKITPREQQVAIYRKVGDYISFLPKQIMTKQDAPYIKAYRLTVDGKPIKGTPTFNFEEHHSTPLALMQAEAYLTNPSPKNAMEHVLTYQNQRKVNGSKDAHYDKFLVLDKTEHTGINGIHYNDKWSLQDLQRIKALSRSGRFKTMDDLLYYYDRLKAQQLSYLPKAKQGTKLIPKNAFGSTLMRELVPKASKITGKTERQLIKELAQGTLSEKKLIELTKDVVESVNGKILKPEQIKPGMLDFEHYWYFGHGTDVEHLPSIMQTGLKGSLSDTAINQFLIGNQEVFDAALEMAKQGKGLHHNAKGFNVIQVPKLPGQTKPPKDLLDYLTPEEVTSHIVEDRTPARFNYFAVDTTI